DDFPQPIGGTANQPLFSLRQVESWLRRYGKSYQVSLGDRAWQRLKAAGDLHLGELVARAGALLTGPARLAGDGASPRPHAGPGGERAGQDGPGELAPELTELIRDLGRELGPRRAYEFLCERYLEAHSRRLSVTREDVA